MLKRSFLTLIFITTVCAFSAFAQSVHTPEKGSPERKAILDTLRAPVEKKLKQKVAFNTDRFNSSGTWAFVNGSLQNEKGGKLNYSKTEYAEAQKEGMFDDNFQALLKKTAGKWKVVTYAIGCTDVCYASWWKDYRAPKAVFPYSE
jgi:hypothetical protein